MCDQEISNKGKKALTLQSVLCGRRNTVEIKLNVMRGLLSRSIAAFGNSNETVGGLVIEESAYH